MAGGSQVVPDLSAQGDNTDALLKKAYFREREAIKGKRQFLPVADQSWKQ
ncbi:MAG: hypothetical protein E7F15_01010 [Clostridiales bacterium]|nr:hypothetical protein [Clostridiales bacterium]